ncbi:DMT family transporter [Bdellovibrio reynosensis]|uniref:EamA family transporter n=1 Tax=Bdellovibrio reynosensis TaxID=2835041 RepID=A0ABY4CCV7_9BACT|nr:EamA family transporter [Bdellovibrio reynosensis]UOF02673.1 EamA family transporter [Bdellovibrio reynosensis]
MASKKDSSKFTGYSLAFLAALMWGISGTLAQFLFEQRSVTAEWLVTIRLLVSGVILLSYPLWNTKAQVIAPWKNKRDAFELIAFGILGMLAVQYTYFAAIKHSNAATATILQYLGPVFIACYYSVKEKRIPIPKELIAIFLALFGTFLIVTHGSIESLSMSNEALFWGISSAVALAVYSILPIRLMERYDAKIVVGWGMLIGGVAFSLINSPLAVPGVWDMKSYLFTAAIIIFGTTVAFYSYLLSIKIIGATKASLLACAEPLSAAIIAVIWLNVTFGLFDWIGTACILATIALLTKEEAKH